MKYFIIAGEASGDLHASNLMHQLKEIDKDAEFCYLGGDLMQAVGGKLIIHYREMAFMGFWNVIKNGGKVLNNLKLAKEAIEQFQPDVVILVDYPSFNLRIARFVKENFNTPVFYYISPKLWAWKEFRIKQIKKYVDKMFTIFPFETSFYKKHNYEVEYVGNPTVDSITTRPNQDEKFEQFIKRNNLDEKPIIALLPGSRKQEITACLPRMIEAAKQFENYQIVVSGAPGNEINFYNDLIGEQAIVFNQTYELLTQASVAVVNSGTATLETALIGTPQVVVYHVALSRIALKIKPYVIKTKFVSLVNILAGKEVVKELLGHHFTINNLTLEIEKLLNDASYQNTIRENYDKIKLELGENGSSYQAAKAIFSNLKEL